MGEPQAGPPPTLEEVMGWIGWDVDDVGGNPVGTITGVYVDGDAPSWIVVELRRGGLLGRIWPRRGGGARVPVPARDCAGLAGRVWTGHRAEALRGAPTVDPARPLLCEHELALCAHYGIGERVGRAAELRSRPQGAVTSRPA